MAALAVAGCAEWDRQPEHSNQLPPARMSPDAVVLELAFVRLPVADRGSYDAIWSQVDEQHFAPELRKELAANGLRAGVLGQQLPTELRAALDAAASQLEERAEDIETNDTADQSQTAADSVPDGKAGEDRGLADAAVAVVSDARRGAGPRQCAGECPVPLGS